MDEESIFKEFASYDIKLLVIAAPAKDEVC
jgi:hypothetical protein